MARKSNAVPIDQIVANAVDGIAANIAAKIERAIVDIVALEVKRAEPVRTPKRGRAAPARRRRRRPARTEIAKWVADKRARRVPTFVIEMTGGLDTKKKIVAKFGENCVFEKGKPLPKIGKAA